MGNLLKILILSAFFSGIASAQIAQTEKITEPQSGFHVQAYVTSLTHVLPGTVDVHWRVVGNRVTPTNRAVSAGLTSLTSGVAVQSGATLINVDTAAFDNTYTTRYTGIPIGGAQMRLNSRITFGSSYDEQRQAVFNIPHTPDQPQTVTITPASAEIGRGGQQTYTASGGQNGYVWTYDAGLTKVSETANSITVTSDISTVFSISVSSPAGNGYAESNTATATLFVTEGEAHWITVNETNTSGVTLLYRLLWKGQILDSWELAPGESKRERYQVEDETPGQLEWAVKGFDQNGAIWSQNPVPNYRPGQNVVPVPAPIPHPEPLPTDTQSVVPEDQKKELPQQPKKKAPGLWISVTPGNSNNPVTAQQSAEGTDKILGKLDEIADSLMTNETVGDGDPGEGPNEAEDVDGKVGGLVDGLVGKLPAAPTIIEPGVQTGLQIPFVVAGRAYTGSVDFTEWAGPITVFRTLCSGCMLIVFGIIYTRTIRSAVAT